MKQNQANNNQKNADFLALINQEYTLVIEGKSADKLAQFFHDYETDPLSGKLEKVQGAIEKYAQALLIDGQYLELGFLYNRYDAQLGKNAETLEKIINHGQKEELRELWENVDRYTAQLGDKNLTKRIREGTIDRTLAILAKYYINFEVDALTKLAKISEKELLERGAEVKEGFIQLRREEVSSDCLQNKLRELAIVALRMSKLE